MRIESRLAVAIAIVAVTGRSYADDRAPVTLQIEGCESESEIRRIVGIELANASRPTQDVRASVTCSATQAALRVASGNAAPTERTVDLAADASKAHGRLIALALVELIATTDSEQGPPEPPTPIAEPPAQQREPGEPSFANGSYGAQREAQGWHVLALGGGLAFSSGTGLLAGGGVRVGRTASLLTLHVDAQAHQGTTEVTLGRVTTTTFDAAAALGLQRSGERVRAYASAGLRGGAVRLAGSTDQMTVRGDRYWAPWFGALALTGVELHAAERLAFMIEIEGGVVISPVGALVGQQREIAVDGAWLGVHVGIGMIL